jgi:hypothetical protein
VARGNIAGMKKPKRSPKVTLPPTIHITQDFENADPDKIARAFKKSLDKVVEEAARPTWAKGGGPFQRPSRIATARAMTKHFGKIGDGAEEARAPAQQARDRRQRRATLRRYSKRQAEAEKRFKTLMAEYERGGQNAVLGCIETLAQEGFVQVAAGPRALNAVLACIERCIYRVRITSAMTNAGVPSNFPMRSFPVNP